MPSKKSSQQSAVASSQGAQQGGGGVRPPSPVLLSEGMDPVLVLLGIIDKKTRNLEKRKVGVCEGSSPLVGSAVAIALVSVVCTRAAKTYRFGGELNKRESTRQRPERSCDQAV